MDGLGVLTATFLPSLGVQMHQMRQLSDTAEERDLGIIVTDNLGASVQCAEAAKKAMQVLGMIRRQFKDIDRECFVIAYFTKVSPQ